MIFLKFSQNKNMTVLFLVDICFVIAIATAHIVIAITTTHIVICHNQNSHE